jgi:hypothetical protein
MKNQQNDTKPLAQLDLFELALREFPMTRLYVTSVNSPISAAIHHLTLLCSMPYPQIPLFYHYHNNRTTLSLQSTHPTSPPLVSASQSQ